MTETFALHDGQTSVVLITDIAIAAPINIIPRGIPITEIIRAEPTTHKVMSRPLLIGLLPPHVLVVKV